MQKKNIWTIIGGGITPPEPIIVITSPVLFNIALSATADESDTRHYLSYLLIDPAE